jgi:excisionase family DNA binding protein
MLGLSVGTIQNLVEKNELQAWKTQGGHRRISMQSLRDYQRRHNILAKEAAQSASELKVLVVEDDKVTREMLRTLCRQCEVPIDCTVVATGVEALIDISIIMPDVLIADLNMPGVDGFLLLRTLCQSPQFSHMTTLVLSSLTAKEIKDRGGLPDGIICIAKPVQAQWITGFFAALMAGRLSDMLSTQEETAMTPLSV